jgi:hypothetical protein
MKPAEITAARAELARLEAVAVKKLDLAIATGKALAAAQQELFESTRSLEAEHRSDWWRHSETPARAELKAKMARLYLADRSAERAWKIAEGKAQRAGRFQVLRTYTDRTGWVENLKAFLTDAE